MDAPRPSFHDISASGEAVARAAHVGAAFDALVAEASRVFGVRAAVVEKSEGIWTIRSATDEGAADLAAIIETAVVAPQPLGAPPLLVPGQDTGADAWTALSLQIKDAAPAYLLLAGNWIDATPAIAAWTTAVALAVSNVRERSFRTDAERALVAGYAVARRLSRLGGSDRVYKRIVDHIARLLDADRVALAIYRPADDCLAIEATTGYPVASVRDIRIEPGSWVIGHVFSSGRPVFVRDVRQVRGMASTHQRYRTYSFIAVPLFAGSQTVGVLTATDKRDGTVFTRQDALALRMAGVAAALAIVAARSHDEAGRLSYAATVDSLTGLHNRPYLDERLHQEMERARRGGYSLAVLMADIDDFKIINDTYGHQGGDAVLQVIGGILRSAVRVFDVCARYGGDEFAILMPSSDAANAAACGERIRRRVAEYRNEQHVPPLPPLTMSIGVAVTGAGDAAADVIMRADRCLYQAKAAGKNRVCVHPSTGDGDALLPAAPRQKESM